MQINQPFISPSWLLFCTETTEDVKYVKTGSSLTFNCPFKSASKPVVWRGPPNLIIYSIDDKVNKNIYNQHQLTVTEDSVKGQYILRIMNCTEDCSGIFRCDTVIDGLAVEQEFYAALIEPPSYMQITTSSSSNYIYANEGSEIEVECEVECGNPPGTLAWVQDEYIVLKTKTCYNTTSMSTVINSSRSDHMTTLTCIAENSYDQLEMNITIYLNCTYFCISVNAILQMMA
ncbi:unnamed protein product [Mytilus coruscus]|uniref:Ig-like domain-containing protein n=1 Tax=Mytilus coruscus TaxID=42192 RepID=A0A6J8DDE8_MYTCO|nr:unnamed protein product [Mytilus coruscus]